MKKFRMIEKIILTLVVVAVICGISTVNYATGDVSDLFSNPVQIPTEQEPSQSTQQPTQTQTPTTPTQTDSAKLPKTGANDTGIWILAGAFVVIAVYTYRKVKYYNV